MVRCLCVCSFLVFALCYTIDAKSQPASTNEVSEQMLEIASRDYPATYHISTEGNDAWSGRLREPNQAGTDGPFASFERAAKAVRDMKKDKIESPIAVVVGGGEYVFTKPLLLSENDGGSSEFPVLWRAENGETVKLVGGKYLNNAKKVSDPEVLSRLPESVRDKIVEVDLRAVGTHEYGRPTNSGVGIFFRGKPAWLARYPNKGFMKIASLSEEGTTPFQSNGYEGIREGIFQFDDPKPTTWENEKDIWVNGYWCWDWSDERQQVESIDASTRTMKIRPPYHVNGYRLGQWFYAYNLLSELDEPGEFYIDREKGLLYFYPEGEIRENELLLTELPNLVTMENVSHVVWQGFLMEGTRGTLMEIEGGIGNLVVGCTFRNTTASAIKADGEAHTVFGCHLYNLGDSGIRMKGGDRPTLTPGRHRIVNNEIHHYGLVVRAYSSGAAIDGVGNHIGHNHIYDAPHMAIGFDGNDHLIEYNEIDNVCKESNDAGAIYTGRNWTTRGNLIRGNYFHDISGFENRGCCGVYFDDMFASAEVRENLFVRVRSAMFIGGGRDNLVVNNVFIDCRPSIHIDVRAFGWAKPCADSWVAEAKEKNTISGIRFKEPPYSARYPELAKIMDDGKNPYAPEGNVIMKNIVIREGIGTYDPDSWTGDGVEDKAVPFNLFKDNLVNVDPGFIDVENGDYRFKKGSPGEKMGMVPIPYKKMGLQKNPLHVKHD